MSNIIKIFKSQFDTRQGTPLGEPEVFVKIDRDKILIQEYILNERYVQSLVKLLEENQKRKAFEFQTSDYKKKKQQLAQTVIMLGTFIQTKGARTHLKFQCVVDC